jgi:hypothetical protein
MRRRLLITVLASTAALAGCGKGEGPQGPLVGTAGSQRGCRPAGATGSERGYRPTRAARRTRPAGPPGRPWAPRRSGARRSARPARSEGRQGGQRQSRRVREQDPANRLWIRRMPGRLRRRGNRDLGILWRKRSADTPRREGRAVLEQRGDRTTSRSDLR